MVFCAYHNFTHIVVLFYCIIWQLDILAAKKAIGNGYCIINILHQGLLVLFSLTGFLF